VRDAATGALQQAGKLSLVDLAGSERVKRSEATGERLREAQHINRSLSALADVISAKERRVAYVPYRNSKLTHLLQDALGGQQQCRTIVIVALPPSRRSLSDTMHSLQLSSRLTALSIPMVAPRRSLSTLPEPYRCAGQQLRRLSSAPGAQGLYGEHLSMEVERLRGEFAQVSEQLTDCRSRLEERDRELEEAQKQNRRLRASTQVFEQTREQLFHGFAALNQRLEEVEEAAMVEDELTDLLPFGGPGSATPFDDTPLALAGGSGGTAASAAESWGHASIAPPPAFPCHSPPRTTSHSRHSRMSSGGATRSRPGAAMAPASPRGSARCFAPRAPPGPSPLEGRAAPAPRRFPNRQRLGLAPGGQALAQDQAPPAAAAGRRPSSAGGASRRRKLRAARARPRRCRGCAWRQVAVRAVVASGAQKNASTEGQARGLRQPRPQRRGGSRRRRGSRHRRARRPKTPPRPLGVALGVGDQGFALRRRMGVPQHPAAH